MTPPDGIPWIAWAAVVLAIAVIGSVPGVVAALVSRRDMATIKAQVKNTHDRNLREDLDSAVESANLAAASAHRTERYVADLNETIRAMQHSLDRRSDLQTTATDELRTDLGRHIDEVPQMLAREVPPLITAALEGHMHDCPLRSA